MLSLREVIRESKSMSVNDFRAHRKSGAIRLTKPIFEALENAHPWCASQRFDVWIDGHTYITFHRFSWQAVIDRANER
jgi:hypothetical protein